MTQFSHSLGKFDRYLREKVCREDGTAPLPQTFGRIGPCNPVTGSDPHGVPFGPENLIPKLIHILDHLKNENDPKKKDAIEGPFGPVAAGMTFFGQFIDHDITLDTTSAIGSRTDPRSIRNVRTPGLDLDCLYGDGPEASPHQYSKDFLLIGREDNPRDLPRNCKGTALIGDPRNDENQILSQIQGAFIDFHNIVYAKLKAGSASEKSDMRAAMGGIRAEAMAEKQKEIDFETVRRIVRLHYQWIILHDFLPSFVDATVLGNVMKTFANNALPGPFNAHSPIMPIEFSVAAYRFGHATVRNAHRIGTPEKVVDLFDMDFLGGRPRPTEKNLQFIRMFDLPGAGDFDVARRIGLDLSDSIFNLPPGVVGSGFKVGDFNVELEDARKLPLRNVIRDRFTLEIASGQQMANLMGFEPLAPPKAFKDAGITKTPLWIYCLQEAEHHGGKLGPVGGTMVATVFLRLLHFSPESLLCSAHDFHPFGTFGTMYGATKVKASEMKGSMQKGYSLGHLMKFVQDNRDNVASLAGIDEAEIRCDC